MWVFMVFHNVFQILQKKNYKKTRASEGIGKHFPESYLKIYKTLVSVMEMSFPRK